MGSRWRSAKAGEGTVEASWSYRCPHWRQKRSVPRRALPQAGHPCVGMAGGGSVFASAATVAFVISTPQLVQSLLPAASGSPHTGQGEAGTATTLAGAAGWGTEAGVARRALVTSTPHPSQILVPGASGSPQTGQGIAAPCEPRTGAALGGATVTAPPLATETEVSTNPHWSQTSSPAQTGSAQKGQKLKALLVFGVAFPTFDGGNLVPHCPQTVAPDVTVRRQVGQVWEAIPVASLSTRCQ